MLCDIEIFNQYYNGGFMNKKVVTTYDMVADTLRIVRQIRFLISLTMAALMAIGSICVLMIF